MLAAAVAGASHPAVAVLLGLGATGLAGAVVAMAWNVHVRQIKLAEQLARRQFIVTGEAGTPGHHANGNGDLTAALDQANGAAGAGSAPVVIDGPETVVTGEQARYRVRAASNQKLVSWAAGGGALAQAPDPSHPGDLLVVADQPGSLTITARVREGMTERRATKSITAVTDVTDISPPFTLRLFLNGWGLAAVAVLIAGFAGALAALGTLPPADFIALVSPLAALLAITALGSGSAGTCPPPARRARTDR
jgi:hypothetical protein